MILNPVKINMKMKQVLVSFLRKKKKQYESCSSYKERFIWVLSLLRDKEAIAKMEWSVTAGSHHDTRGTTGSQENTLGMIVGFGNLTLPQ